MERFLNQFVTTLNLEEPEALDLTPESHLLELAYWDSIAVVSLIIFFDVEYGRKVSAQQIKTCVTMRDLYQLINQ